MEATPGKRILIWREYKGFTPAQMIKATGIKRSTLDSAEDPAGSNPSYDTLMKVAVAFPDLNTRWLLTGEGEMLADGRALTPAHAKPATTASLSVAYPTPEEYRELQRENQELREQLARKEGALVAVEEDRTWLRKQIGGKTEASADAAAEDEYESAYMEASRNHEYQPEREYAAVAASCNRDAYNWMDYATR